MPLRCLLADDEPLALRLLESYVQRTPQLELCGAYTDAAEALQAIGRAEVDVAFLDIQMPEFTGLDLARAARDSGVRVVFVTAYREFAVDGFRVNALDYLLKPVSYSEFCEAVDRAVATLTPQSVETPVAVSGHMMVRSDYRQVKVEFANILYIEGLKDYVKIYTSDRDRPLLTQMSLKAVENTLPHSGFMRIHRSYIVAVGRLQSYDRTHATVAGTAIPIGDTYRAQFLERMGTVR